jgi:hypothetical protein
MQSLIDTALATLMSPMVLFFVLGLLAATFRSDLAIPEPVSKGLSLYLMLAIGFRGGVELEHGYFGAGIIWACLAAVLLSLTLPVLGYLLLRRVTKLDPTNAAAVAAHYGSVSVVTFAAAMTLLEQRGVPFEAYVVALLALMEAPAIISGLFLSKRGQAEPSEAAAEGAHLPMREVFLSGSVVLLLGSFVIGWATGERGMAELAPIVDAPFKGALCLFLLDMGLLTARRASELRGIGLRVAAFGLYMPLVGAAIGLFTAKLLGLSIGGATLLTVLAASASYIVVPAAMRSALPAANPALYLTLSLGITFPFNLVVGIPLYEAAAEIVIADSEAKVASVQQLTSSTEEP